MGLHNLRLAACFCGASVRLALWLVARQLAFHVLNVALGVVATAVTAIAMSVALVLLPVRGMAAAASALNTSSAWLGALDAMLHNASVDRVHDKLSLASREETAQLLPLSSTRLVAPRPVPLAVVYFGVVRLALALLSVVGLALVALFATAFVGDGFHVHITDRAGERFGMLWIYAECVTGAAVGSVVLASIRRLSLAATRAFA